MVVLHCAGEAQSAKRVKKKSLPADGITASGRGCSNYGHFSQTTILPRPSVSFVGSTGGPVEQRQYGVATNVTLLLHSANAELQRRKRKRGGTVVNGRRRVQVNCLGSKEKVGEAFDIWSFYLARFWVS